MLTLLLFCGMFTSALAQSASAALQSADSIVSGLKDTAFHLVMGVIGIIGAFLLIWQGSKAMKGDPQTKDSLLAFGGAVVIIVVFLEILKILFF